MRLFQVWLPQIRPKIITKTRLTASTTTTMPAVIVLMIHFNALKSSIWAIKSRADQKWGFITMKSRVRNVRQIREWVNLEDQRKQMWTKKVWMSQLRYNKSWVLWRYSLTTRVTVRRCTWASAILEKKDLQINLCTVHTSRTKITQERFKIVPKINQI